MARDFLERASAAYLSESVISLILAIILIYYYRIYKRQFLYLWALSWTAGFLNLLALCIIIFKWNSAASVRHIASFTATFFQSAQLLLLLLGSTSIVLKKTFTKRHVVIWTIALLAISLAVTLPYITDSQGEIERYAIRVGFRYSSILVAFIAAGLIISRQQQLSGTIGRKLIAFSFLLFGLYQAYYILIVIGNIFGNPLPIPLFFGIVEIVLISLIGLSMIVYLLEEEHRRLISTNEELANFLYRTSHDLRSPIATMLSVLLVARKQPSPISSEQALDMIENRVKKLDTVISNISEMRLKTAGEINQQTIKFDQLIKSLVAQAQNVSGSDTIRFEYSASPTSTFISDYNYVRDILWAMIENSIKYRDVNKEQSRVVISMRKKSNILTLEVWDNGKGIHQESLPNVFNMFYRGDTVTDGTGLGLYLAYSMVKKLDGKIQASSVYGEYARFVVTLTA